jgi:hypothetical protein
MLVRPVARPVAVGGKRSCDDASVQAVAYYTPMTDRVIPLLIFSLLLRDVCVV